MHSAKFPLLIRLFPFCLLAFWGGSARSASAPVALTLFHTNDLHSQYRPLHEVPAMGGVARLKTLITRLRSETQNSFFLDGGDWSEGNIYYNLGAGTESLRMMDYLGYDVALIGNHDWLNGPDQIVKVINEARPRVNIVAGNFDLSTYRGSPEFKQAIAPYVIKNVNGLKVAFIGVATYEFVFDEFLAPVKILNPFTFTRELAARLKPQVDAIVVISHNSVTNNQSILKAAPDVDLVIGAHDHLKLIEPLKVPRPGRPDGWVVEAGCWGRYLGRVDLKILPRAEADALGVASVQLNRYQLYPIDDRIAEDPEINRRIDALEAQLEGRYGPIFHDHVATNQIKINHDGKDNLMGNLTTDSFLDATRADFALDQTNFIYGELFPGEIRTADVFNSDPAIYNPATDKAWTVKTFQLKGSTLNWLMALLFSNQKLAEFGIISTSGLELVYDPRASAAPPNPGGFPLPFPFPQIPNAPGGANSVIQGLAIQGRALDVNANYRVAAGEGVVRAIQFLNSFLPGAIPLTNLTDTGLEGWRLVADRLHNLDPIIPGKISVGTRIRTSSPDLSVTYNDLSWTPLETTPTGIHALLNATVTNFGMAASPGTGIQIQVFGDLNGSNTVATPRTVVIGAAQTIPSLRPLETQNFQWDLVIPGDRQLYPLTVSIDKTIAESNHINNDASRCFTTARQFPE